jgi:NAD(P)-dependent dehydrogenase (short-subunit alcohol dehydrogenase family)
MEAAMPNLNKTAIVVGASRGFGRAIATSLAEAGVNVIAVSRTEMTASDPAGGPGTIRSELADAQ